MPGSFPPGRIFRQDRAAAIAALSQFGRDGLGTFQAEGDFGLRGKIIIAAQASRRQGQVEQAPAKVLHGGPNWFQP